MKNNGSKGGLLSSPIIQLTKSFSCFLGILKGSISITVNDDGTTSFPTDVSVSTNYGSGSGQVVLSGNQTKSFEKDDITVEATVSNWNCTSTELSFHLKIEAKKSIFSCTILDQDLRGQRADMSEIEAAFKVLLAEINEKEAEKAG